MRSKCKKTSASSSIDYGKTANWFDLHQPIDIRHIATLVDQSKTTLFSTT